MDVGEYDDLAPLPLFSPTTSPKRARPYRTVSSPAVVQSRVVPTPGPDQIISTLIDSLTAISQSARDRLRQDLDVVDHKLEAFHDEDESDDELYHSPNEIYAETAFTPPIYQAADIDDEESDDEAAAAPVIRFSRAPPPPPIPQRKRPPSSHSSNAMLSERGLIARKSAQSLRLQDGSNNPTTESVEKENGSITSLAFSILSTRTRSRSRKTSPTRTTGAQPSPTRPSTDRTYSDSVVPHGRAVIESDTISTRSVEESPASTPLSPLNREKLEEHLIPSRQSSIRNPVRRGHHRHSTGSRDLRDLQIDEELMRSDNSTVRRIKELQEAKEKRHSEWRKESTSSSDTPSKRHSTPSPKSLRRSSTYQSSKLSVTEVLVESEHEGPQLSAQISAADLALMPAIVTNNSNSPLTPVGGRSSSLATAAPAPNVPSSVPVISAPIPPRDRTSSMTSKRVSIITTKGKAEDIKSIHEEVEAFLSASRLTQKLRHPRTGRTIAFSEVGDPNGFVVMCCVGMGLTRYVMSFYDELARTLKLRLITPDRPGVGESEAVPERLDNPMTWVDDVGVICEALEINRFSLLAHSAGTIYAMATALKLPQFVRGRIHLLAPWIPPSQMLVTPTPGLDNQPVANLPMSHRILSVLPTSMLKVANSRFLSATSASVDTKPSAAKKSRQLDVLEKELSQTYAELKNAPFSPPPELDRTQLFRNVESNSRRNSTSSPGTRSPTGLSSRPTSARITPDARATLFNTQLTHRIWTLATLNANPAADLMTCLERKKPIGFRYADVTRSIVIRHGAKDTRVPLDNVKWLDSIMKRSELRILDEEGHSLMANASVMSSVLSEISKEWDEWDKIARSKDKKKRETMSSSASLKSAKRSIKT